MKKKIFYVSIITLLIYFSISLKLNPNKIFTGIPNFFQFINYSIPPNLTILQVAGIALWETFQIAFVGTILGTILSLPLAVLASRNLFGKSCVIFSRSTLAAFRTLPSLLWAVIFVIMVGTGSFAGVLATMMYTAGYLGKLQYEAIEGIGKDPLEAIRSTGASRLQVIRFVAIPESANSLLSHLLFMFDYNVRASTILGFVGAGGIGFYLSSYLKFLEYDKVLTLLILIFVAVLIIDYASMRIRDRYLTSTKN